MTFNNNDLYTMSSMNKTCSTVPISN